MIRENKVRRTLKAGGSVLGTFAKITDPSVAEILGLAGLDFFVLDNEHVAINRESVNAIIRAADLVGIVPVIRVKENRASEILQVLDAGALGVQVPQVNSGEQAAEAAAAARYAPLGRRGFAPTHRSARYGLMDPLEYVRLANENVLLVCYCETVEAVQDLDRIVAVEGIDVIFIGPMDLSMSMGIVTQTDHPRLQAAIDTIVRKSRDAGKAVGIIAASGREARAWMDRGIQYVTVGSDQGMIAARTKQIVAEARG